MADEKSSFTALRGSPLPYVVVVVPPGRARRAGRLVGESLAPVTSWTNHRRRSAARLAKLSKPARVL